MTAAPAQAGVNPWLCQTVRIAEVIAEIPGVATYELEFADAAQGAGYRFQPGQFNMLYLPGAGEAAISLSAHPRSNRRWSHTIRAAGNVTRSLARLGPGDTLGLRGPYGSSWPLDDYHGCDVVLAAGGIGLPPLRPAIYHIFEHRSSFGRVTLLYGARTAEGLLYTREYAGWTAGGIDVQTTVDRASAGWTGNVGTVTLLLDRLPLGEPARTVVFACGPDVMMHYTARSALHRGISGERVWISSERNMQCAVGLCGHCQLGPEFVCKDGPVFRYERLAPLLRVEGL